MKVKFFGFLRQDIEEFHKTINDFCENVDVIDVKFNSNICDYEDTSLDVMILYKEKELPDNLDDNAPNDTLTTCELVEKLETLINSSDDPQEKEKAQKFLNLVNMWIDYFNENGTLRN